jgi:hypothetical protein
MLKKNSTAAAAAVFTIFAFAINVAAATRNQSRLANRAFEVVGMP